MSVIRELRQRAALALSHVEAALDPHCTNALERVAAARAILVEDAKKLPQDGDPTASGPVQQLQAKFARARREAGNITAAMCIVAPGDGPGKFRFHFSGHEVVVKLLQGKAGLKVAHVGTDPAAPGGDRTAEVPPDMLAAKREEKAVDAAVKELEEKTVFPDPEPEANP